MNPPQAPSGTHHSRHGTRAAPRKKPSTAAGVEGANHVGTWSRNTLSQIWLTRAMK